MVDISKCIKLITVQLISFSWYRLLRDRCTQFHEWVVICLQFILLWGIYLLLSIVFVLSRKNLISRRSYLNTYHTFARKRIFRILIITSTRNIYFARNMNTRALLCEARQTHRPFQQFDLLIQHIYIFKRLPWCWLFFDQTRSLFSGDW